MWMQQDRIPSDKVIDRERYLQSFSDHSALEVSEKVNTGINLRCCRTILKLSREEVAMTLGISSSQYRKYEEGKDWMKMHTAMRFMIEFGIPITWLFADGAYGKWCPARQEMMHWLPIQALVGCCNDKEFNTFVALLRDKVVGIQNIENYLTIEAWPSDEEILNEEKLFYDSVANGLKCFRQDYGLLQHQMAELLDIDCRTLSGYEERGKQTCFSMMMAMRFWSVTGVSPLFLIKGIALYRRSMLQHRRMSWLRSVLQDLSKIEHEKVIQIANFIRTV